MGPPLSARVCARSNLQLTKLQKLTEDRVIEATPGLEERLDAVLKLPPKSYQQRTIG